ncbi:fatty acid desaturase [Metarhizium album ARSEF 1941]|uniref:Delta 8-(E)-sphingolipid desaturase n=1 Tax=Metarhizium album (strain ARSEF 1941) TaxID=1081103 RepID=A0A0B2X0F9_METAS|nr:fatty acid desaturase [Metarhizium album ARSEF 1941]KHN99162.1 fatty acid desaturase [Metarhizium album ARSEF 1941]
MSRDQVLSPETVDAMIADGDVVVIFEEHVLRLDSWLDRHPGGRLAIMHMVGRDATDEITAYHTDRTLRTMKAYRIGRKPMGPWTNRTPPIRGGVFQKGIQSEIVPDLSETQSSDQDKDFLDEGYGSGVSRVASRDQSHRSSPSPASQYATGSQIASDRALPRANASHVRDGIVEAQKPVDADKADKVAEARVALSPEEWTEWAVQQGKVNDGRDFPPLDLLVQGAIAAKYRLLHRRIQDEGLYACPYKEYVKEMVRYTTLFGLFLYTLCHGWHLTSAVFLGLFWHQIMFTAHDAGHRAITTIFAVDTLIGLFIADFCCGLSLGWWKSSHNVHHLITNMPEHDPDIQNLPLFATCPSFFKSLRSSYYDFTFVWDAAAEFLVPFQKYTYYPVMGIARFNLYLLSWLHVLSSKSSSLGSSKAWWIRPTEIAFMTCYWFLFGYLLLWRALPTWTIRVAFVLISHMVTMPLHVQITLSHWGMSTSDLGEDESFPQRQLRTTLDVDCPAWLDFIHGGLQFQAIHHLFPRVPRHNLRKVQAMVREFCADTNIPYSILGFMDGNRKVISRLDEVSQQVKMLVKCQKYMAETGESGLH